MKLEYSIQADDELLIILGKFALRDQFASKPSDALDQKEEGKNFLNYITRKHKERICSSSVVRGFLYKKEVDILALFGGVVSIILALGIFEKETSEVYKEISAVSTLITRLVVAGYCGEYLEQSKD